MIFLKLIGFFSAFIFIYGYFIMISEIVKVKFRWKEVFNPFLVFVPRSYTKEMVSQIAKGVGIMLFGVGVAVVGSIFEKGSVC